MNKNMDDKAIGLGVIGLGRAFTLMLPTFIQDKRIRLVAAADPRSQARDMFSKDFSAAAYETIDLLCRDPKVEAVYIASPHQFHAEHIAIAAAAGKPMLVEKPLAITMEQCNHIVQTADDTNVPIVVGHSHSFDGPVLHAAKLLRSGKLGPVHMLTALNYTDYLYRPRRPEELDTRQGGGVVFSQAAHQVDIARLLLGGLIHTVRSCTGSWDASRPTEGAYSALLTTQEGAFGTLTYSGYAHYDSDELMEDVGELGYKKEVVYGQARARLSQLDAKAEAELKAAGNYGGNNFHYLAPPPTPYHQHFGHVVVSARKADIKLTPSGLMVYSDDKRYFEPTPKTEVPRVEVIDELWGAIRLGLKPLHGVHWARATTEVCLALLESSRTGQDVTMQFQVGTQYE